MSDRIPAEVPDRVRQHLVVRLLDIPEPVREFAKVLILAPGLMRCETVSRIVDGRVYFKRPHPVQGYQPDEVPPRPIEDVWVDMRTEDGRSLLVAALLPLLVPNNPNKVRHLKWKRQDARRVHQPAWVAVGALYDQWIGPPGTDDVDHQVPGLSGDMDLTQALLHVWRWAKGRAA